MRMIRVVVVFLIIPCVPGMATAQTEWVEHPDNPLIGPGDPGSWDSGGHWLGDVVFDGSMYHMWFTGYEANGDWWDIGHATSPDGIAWTMDPANPVLLHGESGQFDDDGISELAVVHDGTLFHMWYSGWQFGGAGGVGYATSPDGSVWTKYEHNPVISGGTPGSWKPDGLFPGSVILNGDTYQMWAVAMGDDGFVRIGYAKSSDGIVWTQHPEPVVDVGKGPGSFDSRLAGHPDVVFDGNLYHMWYFGDSGDGHRRIGYAYSTDGIQWTKHRYNPVLQSATDVLDSPNVLIEGTTYRMWYEPFDGSIFWIFSATSGCCPGVPALDNWQFIPAAAVASGAQGAFFQTDVDLSNADDQEVDYEFSWLPRGETNSEPVTSEVFTLGAGMSARYANVLAEVFDLEPDSLGALIVTASSPDLLAMSRTYNLPAAEQTGTFGQSMPALVTDEFIAHGETRRILFGTENADMRTNIGCQNATETTTIVYLDLFKANGTSLGRKTMMLRPFGNDQLNRVFDGHNPVNGYVDVSPAQPGNLVYCYGSVLDNTTSDPTTIPPQ